MILIINSPISWLQTLNKIKSPQLQLSTFLHNGMERDETPDSGNCLVTYLLCETLPKDAST